MTKDIELENEISRKSSVIILSMIEMLERVSYYGMRALLILYMVNSEGLNISTETGMSIYGYFTILIAVLPFPLGLITDFTFKQEKGVIIGAIISLMGYLALLAGNIYVIGFALLLIAIGSSLVKPNLSILIGRLFIKEENKRDLAFIILFTFINFGAFISIVIVGYIGQTFGWLYGFSLTAFATLLYLLIFIATKNKFKYRETDMVETNHSISKTDKEDAVLDYPDSKNTTYNNSFTLIFLMTLISIIYSICYGVFNNHQYELLSEFEYLSLFGNEISKNILYSFNSYFSIFTMVILFIIWYIKGVGSTISKLGYGMLILGLASILIIYTIDIPENLVMLYSLMPFSLIAIAETFIAPIVISYITRLSSVKYSSTIYGLFILLSFAIPAVIEWLPTNPPVYQIEYFTFLAFAIGLTLLLFRKKLLILSNGID